MTNYLLIESHDNIAWLTIHYPEKRNALTPSLLGELNDTLGAFSKTDDIRCVVIRGSGDAVFSSGFDISAIPVEPHEQEQRTPDILVQALRTLYHFPYPTIAMLNGSAFGAGFNLCACCDIRIAADNVKLAMTPARLGITYHPEGIQQFIQAFGFAVTKEIFYTAGTFQGADLLHKGLVNHLLPAQEIEDFTRDYARKIAGNAPLSLKGMKTIISMFEGTMALGPDKLETAADLMQRCFKSNDLNEGRQAFLEKRVPRFTGN